ncbi:hypothetical protein U2F26_35480 [Micromonospora sp. 4G57]|uniref:Uncharacterized protein n=2 Tax=Micromonosporaceae TaxID=28056 RepID=A0A317D804_9ACTN|nr:MULTISPECIES: hypothetical protein [unclassified Micromonospora]MBM0229631.1 hypothetical protein [Micromonospora sp. ATA51]MDZ5447932.1 hypothetical protein [Micromonospora sp. 4G57]MDZ5494679.1 hypothetical protein [Micromonospora sp. 4G53]PWR08903.1 hypothetical protein DKT69_32050 [Micromonospora sp. 4G51]
MEIFTYERPAVMPAACAPLSAVRVVLAAARPSVPQVHQVQVQAELTLTVAPTGIQNPGTSGFTGKGIDGAKKRMDVRGVPPRGRPV